VRLYLDASVLIPAIVKEATSDAIDEFLFASSETMVISVFAAAEVASALSRLVRHGRLSEREATVRLGDFDELRTGITDRTEITSSDCQLANTNVHRFNLQLRAPDALNAAICRRLAFHLVTLDPRLSAARELGSDVARQHCPLDARGNGQTDYPDSASHKQQHDALTSQVIEVQEKHAAGAAASLTLEVMQFLRNWLVNHIQGTDQKYMTHLNSKGIR